MNKYFCIEFSVVGFTVALALIFTMSQPVYGQRKDAEQLFKEIRKTLKAPENEIEIHSVAECFGPDGTYTSKAEGDGVNLYFSQVFSYRDEPVELYIMGNEGKNASGEALSNFMIFYGRMHDYVRIALQPEYLLHSVDTVITKQDNIAVDGKTHMDYRVNYVVNNQKLPIRFTFYLNDEQPITTWFEEWMITAEGVKVPKKVRIVDEEKVFTFNYTEISIREMGEN